METMPSKDETFSAESIGESVRREGKDSKELMNLHRFHLRPVVESTVESIPTGSRPHVGPSTECSMAIKCSPFQIMSEDRTERVHHKR